MKQIFKGSKNSLPKQIAFFGLCCLLTGIFALASANTVYAQTTQKAPGDYNGDGKMDIGFYRQNAGTFFTTLSGLPATSDYAVRFGASSDLPIAAYNVFSREFPAP